MAMKIESAGPGGKRERRGQPACGPTGATRIPTVICPYCPRRNQCPSCVGFRMLAHAISAHGNRPCCRCPTAGQLPAEHGTPCTVVFLPPVVDSVATARRHNQLNCAGPTPLVNVSDHGNPVGASPMIQHRACTVNPQLAPLNVPQPLGVEHSRRRVRSAPRESCYKRSVRAWMVAINQFAYTDQAVPAVVDGVVAESVPQHCTIFVEIAVTALRAPLPEAQLPHSKNTQRKSQSVLHPQAPIARIDGGRRSLADHSFRKMLRRASLPQQVASRTRSLRS